VADLAALTAQALAQIGASDSLTALEELRVDWLGRKGVLTGQVKEVGKLKAAERPAAGARINAAARTHELSYSRLIAGLRLAGIEIDRKLLADLAVHDANAFGVIATQAKAALAA